MSSRWLTLALVLSLAGCTGPMAIPGTGNRAPVSGKAGASDANGLAGLIGSGISSPEEQELRDVMRRTPHLEFPIKAGLLFYDFEDPLKGEDHQAIVEKANQDMVATGLVRAVAQLPSALLKGGDSLDAIRKLAARFQVDVLVIVTGRPEFTKATQQPTGFFEQFSNQANYEARSSLTGLALDVFSGTVFAPVEVVGKEGPALLDTGADTFAAAAYEMKKKAQSQSIGKLKDEFLRQLTDLRDHPPAATPAPTPVPSATPPAAVPTAVPTSAPAPIASPQVRT